MKECAIYIAVGDGLNKEMVQSIESIRKNGGAKADIPIRIYYSEGKPSIDLPGVELWPTEIHGPTRESRRMTHRLIKAQLYHCLPAEYCLFLDTDTYCVGDLAEVFDKSDQFARGVPDGIRSKSRDMALWAFGGSKECITKIFGPDYLEAKDTPTAWNVGALPVGYKISRLWSENFLNILFHLAYRSSEEVYNVYRSVHFDEQSPLNFCLWKNKVPTLNLDLKWNMTKSNMKNADPEDVRIIHIRVKNKQSKELFKKFTGVSI